MTIIPTTMNARNRNAPWRPGVLACIHCCLTASLSAANGSTLLEVDRRDDGVTVAAGGHVLIARDLSIHCEIARGLRRRRHRREESSTRVPPHRRVARVLI